MEGKVRDWIERAVVESDRRRCAAKVTSISAENAVEEGDNYLSILKRLTLDVVLTSGDRQTRRLIYKSLPDGENRVKMSKRNGIFVREIRVLQDVIPEMEDILREKEPTAEFLWPELISVQRRYEGLLMEDLSIKGFKMGHRRNGLDYDHCVCVMKSLAKFHALGAILRQKGDLRIKDFYPAVFNSPSSKDLGFTKKLFYECADTMEKEWQGEWVDYAQKLRNFGEKTDDLMEEERKLDDSKFNTLNHGDCWVNNILFRYDNNGKPEALRFVDFQMANYNTPAFDLQYFLMTSPDLGTRDRKPELIQVYQKHLSENLKLFGYPENEIPTLEGVIELYNRARFYGFCVGISLMPFVVAKKENVKTTEELDELSRKYCAKEGVEYNVFEGQDEQLIKIIKYIIKEGGKNDIL